MLRDVLTELPGYATWPCDEINFAWRHGHRGFESDEFTPEMATPKARSYMNRQFERMRSKFGAKSIVEKTCANSLRVGYVHAIKPDARYIFITRDGLDAAVSATVRWNASFDLRYTAAKVKYVPPSDIPYYGARFVSNRFQKRGAKGDRTSSVGWWGPKTQDWRELSGTRPLDEVCMIQWKRCVDLASRQFAQVPTEQVHHVSYEQFVANPELGLRGVLDFLGRPELFDSAAVQAVSGASVGKGRNSLSEQSRARLTALAGDSLSGLGYEL